MNAEFRYDVFLSHSAKDKAVVRPRAERAPDAKGRRLKAKLEIQPSAFGVQLRLRTFRLRDPLNREPLLQPSAFILQPFLSGSLAQFLYTNWRPADREQEGLKARKKIEELESVVWTNRPPPPGHPP